MIAAIDRRRWLVGAASGAAASFASSAWSVARSDDERLGEPVSKSSGEQIILWPQGVVESVPQGLKQAYVQRSSDPAISDRVLQQVTAPFIEWYRPSAKSDGASIVIMPGGGYRYMAWDKEGPDLARWFAERGIHAFVLAYRLPLDGWSGGIETPLADAQRALRIVRHRANDFGIDAARIAVMGFSAGGHLCANVATAYARSTYAARDSIDAESCRPVLAAPIYPAIKLDELGQNIFGAATSLAMLARNTPHRNVTEDAPPHFLVHAEDDPLVDPGHSLALRAALVAKKIPVETHLFAKGGHGFGLRLTRGLPLETWPDRLLAFGRASGWLRA